MADSSTKKLQKAGERVCARAEHISSMQTGDKVLAERLSRGVRGVFRQRNIAFLMGVCAVLMIVWHMTNAEGVPDSRYLRYLATYAFFFFAGAKFRAEERLGQNPDGQGRSPEDFVYHTLGMFALPCLVALGVSLLLEAATVEQVPTALLYVFISKLESLFLLRDMPDTGTGIAVTSLGTMWVLASLAGIQILYGILRAKTGEKRTIAASVACGAAGLLLRILDRWLPLSLVRTLLLFPVFVFGAYAYDRLRADDEKPADGNRAFAFFADLGEFSPWFFAIAAIDGDFAAVWTTNALFFTRFFRVTLDASLALLICYLRGDLTDARGLRGVLESALCLVWIMASNSVMRNQLDGYFFWALQFVYGFFYLVVLYKDRRAQPRKPVLCLVAVALCLWVVQSYAMPQYAIDSAVFVYIPLVGMLLMLSLMDGEDVRALIRVFVIEMVFVAATAVVFYVLEALLGAMPLEYEEYGENHWPPAALSFQHIYYRRPGSIDFFTHLPKNSGLFSESVMLAFVLFFPLTLNHVYKVVPRGWNALFIVALISTTSLTNFLALGVFYLLLLIFSKPKNPRQKTAKRAIVPSLLLIAPGILYRLFTKKASVKGGSWDQRVDHVIASFKVFRKHFPFGCGTTSDLSIRLYETYVQGIAIGLPAFLAMDGIFAIATFVVPMVAYAIKSIKERDLANIAFVSAFFVNVFMTAQSYSLIEWAVVVFIFIGYLVGDGPNGGQTPKHLAGEAQPL